MYPILQSGDLAVVKRVHSVEDVIFGNIYIVSYVTDGGDDYIVLKYIRKSPNEGYLTLASHNTFHADVEIQKSWVRDIAIVKASVRYNTM